MAKDKDSEEAAVQHQMVLVRKTRPRAELDCVLHGKKTVETRELGRLRQTQERRQEPRQKTPRQKQVSRM